MIFLLIIFNQTIDFERLYNQATTSLVKFVAVKDSAMQKFIQLGQDSISADTTLNFLISKFDTKSAAERHTLKNIFVKIGKSSIRYIVNKIDYRGKDEEARSLGQSLWVLSEIGTEEIVEPSARFIKDYKWQIRSSAYTSLGKSKSRNALPYILEGLNDTIVLVRKSAYYALSTIATKDETPYLIAGLNDKFYGVRYSAVIGLKNIGKPAIKFLVKEISSDELRNYFIVQALREIGGQKELRQLIKSSPPFVRFNIYQGIEDKKYLEKMLMQENYPLLKTILTKP